MTDFAIEDQDQATSEADKGRMRWLAIEAANYAPDVSPMARRVLIALICAMDSKTRACFPSELRIAESLGAHEGSVKRAKAELRDKHKLIHWTNPNGPRHQSHYIFNWQKLIRLSQEMKAVSEHAVTSRRTRKGLQGNRLATMEKPQGNRTATMDEPSVGSHPVTMEASEGNSIVAKSLPMVTASLSHSSNPVTPKVTASLPEQPYEQPYRTAHLEHDDLSSRRALADSPPEPLPQPAKQVAPKGALEGRPAHNRETFPYPKLLEAFEDMPNVKTALMRMDAANLTETSKILAMKGKSVAAAYVIKAAA